MGTVYKKERGWASWALLKGAPGKFLQGHDFPLHLEADRQRIKGECDQQKEGHILEHRDRKVHGRRGKHLVETTQDTECM